MTTEISTEIPPAAENDTPKTAEGLSELTTKANLQYSLKNYDAASEIYSQAAELQGELNGELAPQNAGLLYLYGRCIFKVALAKSDLLGGQLVGEGGKGAAMEAQLKATEEEDAKAAARSAILMQITGDDEEDDEEEGGGDGEAEAEEDEDEFANAHDILDLSRVLYERQLDTLKHSPEDASGEGEKGKDQATSEMSPDIRHATERLADTHDLLAEIALENEDFAEAASESKATLQLRQAIFPVESPLTAEGHFKVALAQEFAFHKAVNDAKTAEEEGRPASKDAKDAVDVNMLYEAVENLALAIQSCETRIAAEEQKLASLSADAAATLKKEIHDVKDMVQELKVKLADVGNTAKSVSPNADLTSHLRREILAELEKSSALQPTADAEAISAALDKQDAVTGAAATKPGESAEQRQERIDDASAKATDLSGLVRHKKRPAAAAAAAAAAAEAPNGGVVARVNGKRRLDDGAESSGGEGKKVKFAEEAA